MKTKIALFHPWIKSKGGAERVILEILKDTTFDIDVYTWVYDKEKTFEEFKNYDIKIIAPRFAQMISRMYLVRGLFLPIALFSKIPLEKYDKFLISTSGVAEFITFKNHKPGETYAYVHTPLRAATKEEIDWNTKNRYRNFFMKNGYLFAVWIYKLFEKWSWENLDVVIFNSELSKKRAENHNLIENKKTYIVYPPVELDTNIKTSIKNYFLCISRFSKPKRQELLIKVWKIFSQRHPDYDLVMAGSAENQKYLDRIKEMIKDIKNIEVKTNLTEKELKDLYGNCLAGIFISFMEDFGIVPIEFLSMGKTLLGTEGGYVPLVKGLPQFFKINEMVNEDLMIKEIVRVMEKFISANVKAKKIDFEYLSSDNFRKNINKILKKNEQ